MHLQTQKFRKDINGLRAWAVMAVVLFHLGVSPLQGGFIGVDIFFVLSGYLMTSIIINGLERQEFSCWRFLLARARRIFPPLLTLILTLLLLGWFFLPTDFYQDLGNEAVYALRFSSNIRLAKGMGYFDTSRDNEWLLHAWSLSIEWQFYMLLPLVLMILWKVKPGPRTALIGTIVLVIGSLITSAIITGKEPTRAYFLLSSRIWEMAAGGLVFFASRTVSLPEIASRISLWSAWPVLIASMFIFSESWSWPGLWALVPVTATMLILLANSNNNILVANPVAQWLGDRSYSIYLWHWPVVVALKFALIPITPLATASALMVTFILGDLSWRLIETGLRNTLQTLNLRSQTFVVFGSLFIVFVIALGIRKYPIPGRLPAAVELASLGRADLNPRNRECLSTSFAHKKTPCTYGDQQSTGAVVMGDSHSDSIINSVMLSAKKYQKSVDYMGLISCATLDNLIYTQYPNSGSSQCRDFNKWALERVSQYDRSIPVILVSMTSAYVGEYSSPEAFTDALVGMACRIAEERPVYMMRPVPVYSVNIAHTLYRKVLFQGDDSITQPLQDYYADHKTAWDAQDRAAKECGITILNPLPWLCDNNTCHGSKSGRPLYYDNHHINEFGNRFLIPMFNQVFLQSYTERNRDYFTQNYVYFSL